MRQPLCEVFNPSFDNVCITCGAKRITHYTRKYKNKNWHNPVWRNKVRLRVNKYYQRHAERIKAYQRERRKTYPELHATTNRKWKDRVKNTLTYKLYRQLNRSLYRRRLYNAPGKFTKIDWQHTLETFGFKCAYCQKNSLLTLDHFKSLRNGGHHTIGNIVPACTKCNSSKRHFPAEQWCKPIVYTNINRTLTELSRQKV